MALDIREYAAALAWIAIGVGLWLVALLLGENGLGILSMLFTGIGIANAVGTRNRLRRSAPSQLMLESRLNELESRWADAEIENARLRSEVDFDRQLRSGE